jgi:hypothetical protein
MPTAVPIINVVACQRAIRELIGKAGLGSHQPLVEEAWSAKAAENRGLAYSFSKGRIRSPTILARRRQSAQPAVL